jgi:predicted nucleotidyltransferase
MDLETVIRRERQLVADRERCVGEKKAQCRALLPELVELLKEQYQVSAVILIGSLAGESANFTLDSDIDLVVRGLAPSDYIRAWIDLNEITEPVAKVDLVDWQTANEYMRTITESWGEVLYERD